MIRTHDQLDCAHRRCTTHVDKASWGMAGVKKRKLTQILNLGKWGIKANKKKKQQEAEGENVSHFRHRLKVPYHQNRFHPLHHQSNLIPRLSGQGPHLYLTQSRALSFKSPGRVTHLSIIEMIHQKDHLLFGS